MIKTYQIYKLCYNIKYYIRTSSECMNLISTMLSENFIGSSFILKFEHRY